MTIQPITKEVEKRDMSLLDVANCTHSATYERIATDCDIESLVEIEVRRISRIE